ncbi:uncharacterized protein DS421_20g703810 [Arachis hypogaea]|nr:uncharacterized protein DS421_20g703810 [Arachis hypogaea]
MMMMMMHNNDGNAPMIMMEMNDNHQQKRHQKKRKEQYYPKLWSKQSVQSTTHTNSERTAKPEEQSLACYPREPQHQACEKIPTRQLEQEVPLNVCPPKLQQQACEEALAMQSKQEAPLNVSPRPRHWKDDAPSFSLDISLPTSQPIVTQLEILAEGVMDVWVTAALQFAEEISAEPSLSTPKGYKTSVKEKEIIEELKEKYYQWMTQVKVYKDDSTNEYETIFMLDYKAHLEGNRFHFSSLRPGQDVVFAICMLLNNRKYRRFDEEIYCVSIDIVLFAPICHEDHWWLWIADVKKKAFHVLDPVKKKKNEIPQPRIALNKFVIRVYAGTEPLMDDREGIEAPYITIYSQ